MKTCCDEYCSTHGCNQGRDCPARVAKIGQRIPTLDPLPPSTWRETLKPLAEWMLFSVVLMILTTVIVVLLA